MHHYPSFGRRICVVGTSGSGKTYVAEAIAHCLSVRYISNDALIWRANWKEVSRDDRYEAFEAATRDGDWTFDGNLGPSSEDELVLSRCDTLVWLDLPKWEVMRSIALRTLRRVITRERLWHGNIERWQNLFTRDSMIFWSWRTYPRRKARYAALFADPVHAGRTRIRLRTHAEVSDCLASLGR